VKLSYNIGDTVEIAVPSHESRWQHGLEVGQQVTVHQTFPDEPPRLVVQVPGTDRLVMMLADEVRVPSVPVTEDGFRRLAERAAPFLRDAGGRRPAMDEIEKKARELLAAHFDAKPGFGFTAQLIRDNIADGVIPTREALAVIATVLRDRDEWAAHQVALTPTGENAKHVEVLRGLRRGDAAPPQDILAAYGAAIRALSAPDNAEGEGVACGKCGVRQPLQHSPDCGRSAPKISVSEEILMWCKDTIEALEEAGGPTNNSRAYAIRRVVAACKGVGQ